MASSPVDARGLACRAVTDAELIARAIVSGDRMAFGELVSRHQSSVRQFLRHLTRGNVPHAEDLAQDTFLQAWRSLAKFQARATFNTWLLGIAHNLWRNARRKQHMVPLEEAHLLGLEDNALRETPGDLRRDLEKAMSALGDEERLVLHLCYQQGLSHSEVAATLSWPVGTVKSHIYRAKEKLRPLLASWSPST
jgi:RNA polymerase sigma-70 factor (ECF subfamily)